MKPLDLLDKIFREIDGVILKRQHPVTGLLPASTAVTTHGDYTDAWVRDNVYSIMCVWALGLAYRRQGERERSDQLEQATVKLMRGLLEAMMRQAPKVEVFKHTLNPMDALHAKYSTDTGLPVVADDAWGHLQIDATSLFLLMLGQMSASGLRIVFTYSEVDFVQNLIYYIASAYRTPDFGIWERGNKINNGKTEINASSVGMAKAALQALDGLNLFGPHASPRAVVHSVADSVSLARATLASLLPRESLSKEVDSALLSVIGFPAFAVGDEALVNKTRDKILTTLGGNYGCKRFIWDGHQTSIEDSSRLYYEHTELANFENIESEWPLFFTFLYVDALFNDNLATAQHYRKQIEKLMVEVDGVGLIPELYYLPLENIAEEKNNPRSQSRVPNENVPLVWAQSLYLTGLLVDEGLLTADELDPLKMRRRSTRFIQPQIALVVLAENDDVKNTLAEAGVIAESMDEIKPINVISAPHLVDAYAQVGANSSLGLTGRPMRRMQSLSTSQTYDINGDQFLCLSWIQGDTEDYRGYDAKRIAHKIEQEIAHIRKHWLDAEVAVFTFMVEKRICESPDATTLFQTLRDLQLKTTNQSVGYASAKLAFRASRSNKLMIPNLCITPMSFLESYREKALAQCVPQNLSADIEAFASSYCHKQVRDGGQSDRENYASLQSLAQSYALDQNVLSEGNFSFAELLEVIYPIACQDGHWLTARYCFSLLGKVHTVMADGLTLLDSRHLSVVLGRNETRLVTLDAHLTDLDIVKTVNHVCEQHIERSLVQEVIAIIGSLVRIDPGLFDGVRSIYVHNFLTLCANQDQDTEQPSSCYNEMLAALSPYEFLDRLTAVLHTQRKIFAQGVHFDFVPSKENKSLQRGQAEQAHAVDTDWLEWRAERGLIPRFDEAFLHTIWQSLSHTKKMIFGDVASGECALDCELIRRSMTPGEVSFARLIDEHSQQVHPPYYKSAIIETLYAYTLFCEENSEVVFQDTLNLGSVLEKAAQVFVEQKDEQGSYARKVDVLIEQSPFVLQELLKEVLPQFLQNS